MDNNIIKRVWNALKNTQPNKFNDAFLYQFGGGYTSYDQNGNSYLDNGYNKNSIVYSVVNQQSNKTASIPYYIRKIEDESSKSKLDVLNKATNLAISELLGDANLINLEIENYQKVTAEGIKDQANKILQKTNCSTLFYLKKK